MKRTKTVGKRAQEGEHITVEGGRKAVIVLSWGEQPIGQYVDKYKQAYVVPNKFVCLTHEADQELVGETRVQNPMERAQYRFSLYSNRTVSGEWKDNPTAALDSIHAVIGNKKHRVGANGLLVIGFKYPSLQERIKSIFNLSSCTVNTPEYTNTKLETMTTTTTTTTIKQCKSSPMKRLRSEPSLLAVVPTTPTTDVVVACVKRPCLDQDVDMEIELILNTEMTSDDLIWLESQFGVKDVDTMMEVNHVPVTTAMVNTTDDEPKEDIGSVHKDMEETERASVPKTKTKTACDLSAPLCLVMNDDDDFSQLEENFFHL